MLTIKKPTLKAIFFDIDDTLYSTTIFAEKARKSALQSMIDLGLKGNLEELYKELLEVIQEFPPNFGFHFDKLLTRLPFFLYKDVNRALLIATAVIAYHEKKIQELKIFEDGERLLQALVKTDLILGVITSGKSIKQAEKIIRLGLLKYIHPKGIFISEQVGINKPNPKLYLRALENFGLSPSKSMYVGDHPKKDIKPAKTIGMKAVWVKKGGKHTHLKAEISPDYEIQNFDELKVILEENFQDIFAQ